MRKKLIAGNWKMNKTSADAVVLVQEIVAEIGRNTDVDVAVCPPFTALESVGKALDGSTVKLGAQNMHPEPSGAYTGEISAGMLRGLFASYVILGHSERRTYFGETDAFINQKVLAALKAQLKPILCVGETLAEREAGSTLKVVQTQLEAALEGVSKDLATNVVVAYEPVWAIGTGKVATTEQAQEVHAFIRGLLTKLFGSATANKLRILYGGSMKPANAPELLAQKDIDGGLIGGASLESRSFVDLVKAAATAK
ncbi:MAG TPA: triose-phosphate isomerase [Opitutaceae bacterium]